MALNRYTLNGAGLHGRPAAAVVRASASCSASASVVADQTLTQATQSAAAFSAATTAQPLRTAYSFASRLARARITESSAEHRQSAAGAIAASATVLAYTEREVVASAAITASASVSAIPEAVFAEASTAASAAVTAEATKTQRVPIAGATTDAATTFVATALITRHAWVDDPLITRAVAYGEASIQLSGESIWRHDAFVSAVASATTANSETAALVSTPAPVLSVVATATAVGHRILAGRPHSTAAATATITATGRAVVPHFATLLADSYIPPVHALKTRGAEGELLATAALTGAPWQRYQGGGLATGEAHGNVSATKIQFAQATTTLGHCLVSGAATRVVKPASVVGCAAAVAATPAQKQLNTASVSAEASVDTEGTRVVKPAADVDAPATIDAATAIRSVRPTATVTGDASLQSGPVTWLVTDTHVFSVQASPGVGADSTRVRPGASDMVVTATLPPPDAQVVNAYTFVDGVLGAQADAETGVTTRTTHATASAPCRAELWGYGGTRNIYAFAEASAQAMAVLEAEALSNIESCDPPWRTFTRPTLQTEFKRPFTQTEFTRGTEWATTCRSAA